MSAPDPKPLLLKQRLSLFARSVPGVEVIDELDLTTRQKEAQKADFFFGRRRIICETKTFDDDPTWGALLDNLHVGAEHQRRGLGARLLALTAQAVSERPQQTGLYLWVLEQNLSAQAFYEAHGGRRVERCPVEPPGGVASRITGSPYKLRYVLPVSS